MFKGRVFFILILLVVHVIRLTLTVFMWKVRSHFNDFNLLDGKKLCALIWCPYNCFKIKSQFFFFQHTITEIFQKLMICFFSWHSFIPSSLPFFFRPTKLNLIITIRKHINLHCLKSVFWTCQKDNSNTYTSFPFFALITLLLHTVCICIFFARKV